MTNFCHYGYLITQFIGMRLGRTPLSTIAGISNWGHVARIGLATSYLSCIAP